MFNNRALQVSVVKKDKNVTEPETETYPYSFAERVLIVRDTAEGLGAKLLFGVVIYVAADTIRQVLVKSTPTK